MLNADLFRSIALSFPATLEQPHFDRIAFKVTGKRIFATLLEEDNTANIKLPEKDQSVFCRFDKKAIYPIPNKFGQQGWTTFNLESLPEEVISEALHSAYVNVLEKKQAKSRYRK